MYFNMGMQNSLVQLLCYLKKKKKETFDTGLKNEQDGGLTWSQRCAMLLPLSWAKSLLSQTYSIRAQSDYLHTKQIISTNEEFY